MAIVRGTPIISTSGPTSSFAITLPAYVEGDVWIAIVDTRAITTITAPLDWTQVAYDRAATSSSGPRLGVYYRVPDGTEGANATFTIGGTGSNVQAVVYPMSGVDTQQVLAGDVSSTNGGTVDATLLTNPGATVLYANSFLFNIAAATLTNTDIVFTAPAGWTKDLDLNQTYNDLNVNYRTQTTAGATGAVNVTTDTPSRWVSMVVALKDANEISPNAPPVVSVGNDKTILLGEVTSLSVTHDDPEGQPVTFLWEQVSGPNTAAIELPTAETTEVSNFVAGTYVFRCTVTDEEAASASDTLTVTVEVPTGNAYAYVMDGGVWNRRQVMEWALGSWVPATSTGLRAGGAWVERNTTNIQLVPGGNPTPPPTGGGSRGPIPKPNATNTGPRMAMTEVISSTEALNRLRANGVLQGVRIEGGLTLKPESAGWLIQDCEIIPSSRTLYTIKSMFGGGDYVDMAPEDRPVISYCTISNASSSVMVGNNLILEHCDISDGTDLTKPFKNVEIYGCYLHDLYHPDGGHCDAVQIVSGSDTLIHWNNIVAINGVTSETAAGSPANAVLQTGALNGNIINVQWLDNWVNGGHYTLRGVSSTAQESSYTVQDYIFRRNKHGRTFSYGPIAYMGVRVTYDDTNVWEDDGTPIRP